MNTVIEMHINELDEKLIESLKTLFKDKKIMIHISDTAEAFKETNPIINSQEKTEMKSMSLKEFIGKVNWPMDGLDYQNSIRNEW